MPETLLYFNGVDGDSGAYFLPPMPLGEFRQRVGSGSSEVILRPRPLKPDHDPLDLASAGWGVVWSEATTPAVREALQPLLQRRQHQASGIDERRFRELTYLPEETTLEFLRRQGVGPDLVNPDKLPYYLLLVGGPEEIPFELQCELQVPHAVGRISFEDSQSYEDYVAHLLEAEGRHLPAHPTAAFFGVENPEDPPTQQSVEHLVRPLEKSVAGKNPHWRVRTLLRQAADKDALSRLLHDRDALPSLLFTASHAVRFHRDSPRQRTYQGALLCSDWPGQRIWQGNGAIPESFLFSGEDIRSDTDLQGLIAFHFACYTAGTPTLDSYAAKNPTVATHRPFIGHLPQRLLQQGAVAVVGHVDIALEQSFMWYHGDSQCETFDSTVRSLLSGVPVGHAMDPFGQRLGLLGTLTAEASRALPRTGKEAPDLRRFQLWSAFQDARNYIVLGDPAARINTR